MPRGPWSSGTGSVRVTDMEMPDVVREGLPYDVMISYNSDGAPQFSKACFRWVSEKIAGNSPSLYCYSADVDSSLPDGSACGTWQGAGMVQSSAEFCADVADIRRDMPGRVQVRIRPQGLKEDFNKLEGYLEYIEDGQVVQTNKIGTHILVER